jgi:hypothetical protein
MTAEDLIRLKGEIIQLAGQSPTLEEMARAALAQLHRYFVLRPETNQDRMTAPAQTPQHEALPPAPENP